MKQLEVVVHKTAVEVAKDLREAAERMRLRGFAKFTRHALPSDVRSGIAEREGSVCLLGAFELSDASNWRDAAESRAPQALNALLKLLPPPVDSYYDASPAPRIATWNNADGRTKEQVLALLETAAEKVEAGVIDVGARP